MFTLAGFAGHANAAVPTLLDPGFELYVHGSTTTLANDNRSLGNGAGGQNNQIADTADAGTTTSPAEFVDTIPGWTVTPPGPSPAATTDRFRDDKEFLPINQGDFMGGVVGGTGTFDQNLGVAAQPNATYTLGVDVIDRDSFPAFPQFGQDVVGIAPTVKLRLIADFGNPGQTTLGEATLAATPVNGGLVPLSLVVNTGSTVPTGNLTFEIFASGTTTQPGALATQTFFDNATIAFVPEPTSLALLGLVSLAGVSRRRRR